VLDSCGLGEERQKGAEPTVAAAQCLIRSDLRQSSSAECRTVPRSVAMPGLRRILPALAMLVLICNHCTALQPTQRWNNSERRILLLNVLSSWAKLGPASELRAELPNGPGRGTLKATGFTYAVPLLNRIGWTPDTTCGRRTLRELPPPGVLRDLLLSAGVRIVIAFTNMKAKLLKTRALIDKPTVKKRISKLMRWRPAAECTY
jgi:hypothetical protein